MFKELLEMIWYSIKSVVTSRLFVVMLLIFALSGTLVARLFQIQIVEGASYQNEYIQRAEEEITLDGTRGGIYDRNGNPIAYNQLAYAVAIQDNGEYSNGYEKNIMLLSLIEILKKNDENIITTLPIEIDGEGNIVYSNVSETRRLSFLRDLYGLQSIDDLKTSDEGDLTQVTAQEVFEYAKDRYGIGYNSARDHNNGVIGYEISDEDALTIINIRYAWSANDYQKYIPVTVASNVSSDTVSEVLENAETLQGITIQEESIRMVNDSEEFAHVVGYLGNISSDEQLKSLQEQDPEYTMNDQVGQTGIENTFEQVLKGKKGYQRMYVDNQKRILEIIETEDPQAGNDVYLTIDRDLQVGIYHILEQNLAGILTEKLVNGDVTITPNTSGSEFQIPIKDAYFQLINNNVLSMSHFGSEEASQVEKGIYQKMLSKREQVISVLRENLFSQTPTSYNNSSEETQTYLSYIVEMLTEGEILLTDEINTEDEVYISWSEGNISLREYLYYCLTNGWIDTTKLNMDSLYASTDDTFEALVNVIEEMLIEDTAFTKTLYEFLIEEEVLTGSELCMALFDQGVIEYNEEEYQTLAGGSSVYAYNFLKSKIQSLEITPAQLALDPCSGSVVVTDVKTGEVLALVSYPSYDINRMNTDRDYYNNLNQDQSNPFYNRATRTTTAPGSIFKMVTAIAGLEEGVLQPDEQILATGIFTELGLNLRCHIYPGSHGLIDLRRALVVSCNYFYCTVGWRLSLDSTGVYNDAKGLELIQRYSRMFGFDQKSGVEITETDPHLTDQNPIPSAIGQGSHSYTNVQLNRYATALATRGNLYDLDIVDKVTSSDGTVIEDYTPQVLSHVDVQSSTWDAVLEGMENVISQGGYSSLFSNLPVQVAGKTGTAEENQLRANHANFISYAPYDDPQIAVTVNIPNGYEAANAVHVASRVYQYYYGQTTLEDILAAGATEGGNVNAVDE